MQLCNVCDSPALGLYGTGPKCAEHTPAALAGRPEPNPDPTRSATALASRTDWPRRVPPNRYGPRTTKGDTTP